MILLAQIVLLLLAAWGVGKLSARLGAPALLGMILAGVAVGNLLLPALPATGDWTLARISPPVRMAVLAVVLLRAGLGISYRDLRQSGGLAVGLGLVPLLGDAALVALGGWWLLDLPPAVAAALGFLVAAISPAIVIPGMIGILERRRGPARRVPTALLAGAPLDNIAAVVGLGIALDVALAAQPSWLQTLARIPWSMGIGALLGLAAGAALAQVIRRLDTGWLNAALLWGLSCALIPLCDALKVSFVIAVLTLGGTVRWMALERVPSLSAGLTRVWLVVQVALFGLIGVALQLGPLAGVGLGALAVIALGQVGRAGGVFLATLGSGLRNRERWACVLGYLPKATIQAAFAGVALDRGLAQGSVLLSTAVLAIVLLAPIGAVAVHRGADALLPIGPEEPKSAP